MANSAMGARMIWNRLRRKTRGKLTGAMQGRAMFWLTKQWKREIGIRTVDLMKEVSGFGTAQDIRNVFAKSLRGHFETMRRNGVSYRELGQKMIETLTEMQELIKETNPDRKMLFENLKSKPLWAVLQEMRQHADGMRAAGEKQGEPQEGQQGPNIIQLFTGSGQEEGRRRKSA